MVERANPTRSDAGEVIKAPRSEGAKANMSAGQKASAKSKKHLADLAEMHKGKKRPPETKAAISAAIKTWWDVKKTAAYGSSRHPEGSLMRPTRTSSLQGREHVRGPEYRIFREACGLSVKEAAVFHDVCIRMVWAWESGERTLDPRAADEILELNDRIEASVRADLLSMSSTAKFEKPVVLSVPRSRDDYGYRPDMPFGAYKAMITRKAAAFRAIGIECRVEWMDPLENAA